MTTFTYVLWATFVLVFTKPILYFRKCLKFLEVINIKFEINNTKQGWVDL